VVRQLLRERSSPGIAEHVGALDAELIQHCDDQRGVAAHPQRQAQGRGAAGPRHVDHDQLTTSEPEGQRFPHLDVPADAVEQQQRRALPPGGGPVRRGADAQAPFGEVPSACVLRGRPGVRRAEKSQRRPVVLGTAA
jgi:hypothetical protein